MSACMSGTRGSGVLSSTGDVLEVSVVRGVGGHVYVFGSGQCGWRGGEWMRALGLGFTIPVGPGECWTCGCVLVAVV